MKLPLKIAAVSSTIVLVLTFTSNASGHVRRESGASPPQESDLDSNFLDQLRGIFGRFRNADLQRVFDTAKPIVCSDLVSGTGEWREVAFFNEYRPFGAWYRRSLDEVQRDLAAYVFHGACIGDRSAVQVITQFPVDESVKAYEERRIRLRDVDVNVNAPVKARFESETGAYTFDLPYLFRISEAGAIPLYALNAPRRSDRYAADVTNRWECKSVTGGNVTYQFLICHTRLVFPDLGKAGHGGGTPLGTSAFSILSDGKAAFSSVTFTFTDSTEAVPKTNEAVQSVGYR